MLNYKVPINWNLSTLKKFHSGLVRWRTLIHQVDFEIQCISFKFLFEDQNNYYLPYKVVQVHGPMGA